MLQRFCLFLVLLATLAGNSVSSHAGQRVALVVGINAYEKTPALMKAVADARAVKSALVASLGFAESDVELIEDGGFGEIMAAWRRLLGRAEKNSIIFFYFAGHGIELGGQNYLIPRDASFNATDDSSLRAGSIDFQLLLAELGKNQETSEATGVFILDACRNNPFKAEAKTAVGLSPIRVLPRRVFVMYSAGIGQTALDGREANSVYTTRLLPLLRQQSEGKMALADLAQRLRHDVYIDAGRYADATTGRPHYQTPAYYDQLLTRHTLLGVKTEPERFEAIDANTAGEHLDLRSLSARDILFECAHCPELVVIDAGTFEMGSPEGEPGRSDYEGKRHSVTISRPLAFGKFEVTNREWNACVELGDCKSKRNGPAREPVTDVSWDQATAYAAWLQKSTGQRYRLPTEAEWEYAARSGTVGRFSFDDGKAGNDICAYANGADRSLGSLIWTSSCTDDVGRHTAPVGSYRANPFGLHDMHGNVWEWVQDCWAPSYDGAPVDGTARQAASEPCAKRVARGGSWRSAPSALRSAARNAFSSTHTRATLGFRVVRDLEQ